MIDDEMNLVSENFLAECTLIISSKNIIVPLADNGGNERECMD